MIKKERRHMVPISGMQKRNYHISYRLLQKIVNGYCEQLCFTKFQNVGKLRNFLEKYSLPKWKQGENFYTWS